MKKLFSVRAVWTAAACIGCLSTFAWAQDSASPGNSLGDLARQTRAQHASTAEGKSSRAQELVDEMQQEQEASDNAPLGFKNYNAGDYWLFVPYPFSLEGRENGGAVLLGSRLGITNTEVMAGTPIPFRAGASDTDLWTLARQIASRQGQSAYCSAVKLGERKAFRCAWNGSPRLLGHEVWGTMEIVVASNSLIPVMCVSPDEMQCLAYDQYGYHTCRTRNPTWDEVQKTRAALDTRFRDERTTGQMCDQIIFPSIQLKEDIVVHPATIAEGKASKPALATVPQDASVAAAGSQNTSVADLARRTRLAPHDKAQAKLDNTEGGSLAPPGFQSYTLQYCRNPQQCAEASLIIPEKAEVLPRANGQQVFRTTLNGDEVLLYAGPADVNAQYRSMTDPDYIRMRDLANANLWSREKTDGVSTQELTIAGKPALMTRFRYQRDQKKWWVGERALIDMRDGQFLVGCTAPEERFADAEALCTTLVNSLRLP